MLVKYILLGTEIETKFIAEIISFHSQEVTIVLNCLIYE